MKRIYKILDKQSDVVALVRATSQSAAINHVVRNMFSAKPAGAEDIAALLGEMKIEDA